jgi:hypothetical protein
MMFLLFILAAMPLSLNGYLSSLQIPGIKIYDRSSKTSMNAASEVKIGDLLSDLPTPCMLLEMSLAEGAAGEVNLDDVLRQAAESDVSFEGSLFVHTKVTDTSERDKINESEGSGKSSVICRIDTQPEMIPGGAYLGIGLANHHVGGYYWARGMGIGASLPAHGVYFGASSSSSDNSDGQLFWKKRGPGLNAKETTEESSNSNDGKRSEWADFLAAGDTVELVPNDSAALLTSTQFDVLLGVRRIGRPLGSDPIVERIWYRSDGPNASWSLQA